MVVWPVGKRSEGLSSSILMSIECMSYWRSLFKSSDDIDANFNVFLSPSFTLTLALPFSIGFG